MAFLFFLLATVVAAINEVIQTTLNARARMLTRGIKALLNDDQQLREFFDAWRIKRLSKPAGFVRSWATNRLPWVAERRHPSYIPARAFALTLLETASPTTDTSSQPATDTSPQPTIGTDLFSEAMKTIETIGINSVEAAAAGAVTQAQQRLEAIRVELERSFDEVMDRASGWYKRYVQWWLLGLAVVVVIGLNVNAFTVAERLWKDDTLRSTVVQQAQRAVGDDRPETPQSATPKVVAEQIDQIEQLKLPIGWDSANTRGEIWSRIAGWLVTVLAVTLGAPFWFDALGKLSRLRGTGNREGTAKNDARAAEDRDDPSRRRPALS
jgi:flavin-binding protein dodecin